MDSILYAIMEIHWEGSEKYDQTTLRSKAFASPSVMGAVFSARGLIVLSESFRTDNVGTKIWCSVDALPNVFSPKLLPSSPEDLKTSHNCQQCLPPSHLSQSVRSLEIGEKSNYMAYNKRFQI